MTTLISLPIEENQKPKEYSHSLTICFSSHMITVWATKDEVLKLKHSYVHERSVPTSFSYYQLKCADRLLRPAFTEEDTPKVWVSGELLFDLEQVYSIDISEE